MQGSLRLLLVALFTFVYIASANAAPPIRFGVVTCPASPATLEVGSSINRTSLVLWLNTAATSIYLRETTSSIANGAVVAYPASANIASVFRNIPTASWPIYCQGVSGATSVSYFEGVAP